MRIREYPEHNYRAVFFNGKTVRMSLDNTQPILSVPTPELEDVAINSKCYAGCDYCYTSALRTGNNFDRIVEKAHEVWGSLDVKDRPFQIAIGGAGESTIHPDWIEFVYEVRNLEIMPNYTTNGMHLSDDILKATEEICGGVALSWHPHIEPTFHKAMDKLSELDTKLNVHIIVGDEGSLEDAKKIYEKYCKVVDYFVILPYMAVGRAKEVDTEQVWKNTFEWVKEDIDLSHKNIKFRKECMYQSFYFTNEMKNHYYEGDSYLGADDLDRAEQFERQLTMCMNLDESFYSNLSKDIEALIGEGNFKSDFYEMGSNGFMLFWYIKKDKYYEIMDMISKWHEYHEFGDCMAFYIKDINDPKNGDKTLIGEESVLETYYNKNKKDD